MSHFLFIAIAACAALAGVLASSSQTQSRGAKIKLEGVPSQIDSNGGTFIIEGLTVTGAATTKYENRQDRTVSKEEFFSDLHDGDRVEVKGHLEGNVITAYKIEIERH